MGFSSIMKIGALIPVKGFHGAKQRLASQLSPPERSELMKAMVHDVLAEVTRAGGLETIYLVTGSTEVADWVSGMGVDVIREAEETGETDAVHFALDVMKAAGMDAALVVPGDIPLLRAEDVEAVLRAAPPDPGAPFAVLVPSHDRLGTNALLLSPPDVLRLYLLGVHYRSTLQFSSAAIQQTRAGYERLLAVTRARGGDAEGDGSVLEAEASSARQAFEAAMDDDFNAPRAVGAIFEFGRAINRLAPTCSTKHVAEAQRTLTRLLGVLGIELREPDTASDDATPFIDLLVHLRQQLREAKQWELADNIRDDLGALDVVIEDKPDGTVWRRG